MRREARQALRAHVEAIVRDIEDTLALDDEAQPHWQLLVAQLDRLEISAANGRGVPRTHVVGVVDAWRALKHFERGVERAAAATATGRSGRPAPRRRRPPP